MNEELEIKPTEQPKPEEKKINLTDKDKENFFKAFLSDQPYKETISLFDGKLIVQFRTLNLDENDLIFRQIEYDQVKGVAKDSDSYLIRIMQYRLASSLVKLNEEPFCENVTPEEYPADKEKGETYLLERLKVMSKWPTFKLGAISDAFNAFEAKVRQLTKEAFTEPF